MARLIHEIIDEAKEVQSKFGDSNDAESIQKVAETYIALLNDAPDNPEILFQLGTAYLQLCCFGAAMPLFDRCLDYWPDNPHVWSNLGCCYRALHMLPEARDCFIKALMGGESAETYSNLASSYVNENCPEAGLDYAKRAQELDPDNPKCKWNAGLLFLEMREWGIGFSAYDAGLFCGERIMRNYSNNTPDSVPWWDGDLSKPAAVVLWDEQGIGDRLLAASLLRQLEGSAVDVILECHPRLEGIYRRAFPWVKHFYPTSKKSHIDWPPDHRIDAKLPVMSLSKTYWSQGEFDRMPYLVPDPELVKQYRAEFESYGPGPYYACTWKGGALKTNADYRSLKLRDLRDMIERVGGTWISMQYHEEAVGKVERFREETGLPLFHCAGAQEKDYDHTLAALAAVDHTVTVCNSVVHTCGGAGLPCTVLVPRKRAWRYPDGERFPWYGDHMRMIHQDVENDWATVLEAAIQELIDGSRDRGSRPESAQVAAG